MGTKFAVPLRSILLLKSDTSIRKWKPNYCSLRRRSCNASLTTKSPTTTNFQGSFRLSPRKNYQSPSRDWKSRQPTVPTAWTKLLTSHSRSRQIKTRRNWPSQRAVAPAEWKDSFKTTRQKRVGQLARCETRKICSSNQFRRRKDHLVVKAEWAKNKRRHPQIARLCFKKWN